MNEEEILLKPKEFAAKLGVDPSTVTHHKKKNRLELKMVDGSVFIVWNDRNRSVFNRTVTP